MTSGESVQRRRREDGFTLVELIVVLVIVMILVVAIMVASQSAKTAGGISSMRGATATIDRGIDDFDRIYPRVGTADELLSRSAGAMWGANGGTPGSRMTDETGSNIIKEWPANPYAPGGVRVFRSGPVARGACAHAGARPGDIAVCRLSGVNGGYEIVGYGRDGDGATVEVYREAR